VTGVQTCALPISNFMTSNLFWPRISLMRNVRDLSTSTRHDDWPSSEICGRASTFFPEGSRGCSADRSISRPQRVLGISYPEEELHAAVVVRSRIRVDVSRSGARSFLLIIAG